MMCTFDHGTVEPLNNGHIGTDHFNLSIIERLSSFEGKNVLPL